MKYSTLLSIATLFFVSRQATGQEKEGNLRRTAIVEDAAAAAAAAAQDETDDRRLINNNLIQLVGRSAQHNGPISLGAGEGISMDRALLGMPNGATTFGQTFTVHLRFAFRSGQMNQFTRLIKFTDDETDEYGLYFHHSILPRIGLERPGFTNRLEIGQYRALRQFALEPNEYIDIIFSRDPTGVINIWWYTNGAVASAANVFSGSFARFREPRFAFHSRASFFEDNTQGTIDNLPVNVDFVDVYAGAWTPSQLAEASFDVLRHYASTTSTTTHGIGQVTTRVFFAGTNRQLIDTDIGNYFGAEFTDINIGQTVSRGGSIDDRWFVAITDCPTEAEGGNSSDDDICVVLYTSTNSILSCNAEPNNNFCFLVPASNSQLAMDGRAIFVADQMKNCPDNNPNRSNCFRLRTATGDPGNYLNFNIGSGGLEINAYPQQRAFGIVMNDQLGF